MTKTFAENCIERGLAIQSNFNKLITEHTQLKFYDPDMGAAFYVSINGNYSLSIHSQAGQVLLNKIRKDFKQFITLLDSLFSEFEECEIEMYYSGKEILEYTLKYQWTTSKTTEEECKKVASAFTKMLSTFETMHNEDDQTPIIIPDTNALITQHELAKWTFIDLDKFRMILPPTVVGEIDKMKTNHRVENVRNKANSINRQLKEYRNRGSLLDGVDLVAGKSSLQAIAVEPNFEKAPSWLDADNNDDRILVGIIEIIKRYLHTPIYAVSFDVNFQNKAEYLGIPFLEPDIIATLSPRIRNTNT